MISYWDTSAAVALFFEEPNFSAALQARAAFKIAHMWAGSRVELEAAVVALNRRHRLRAADAGHLYYFHRLSLVHPDAQLVCFDTELCAAARAAKLRVWSPAR